MEIGWTVLDKRAILKRAFIFSQVVLWEIKSSSRESRCLSVRNKVITSFLPRIFSHSIEYPDYLSVCSLKIRKKAIIFPGSKQKGKRSISVSQANIFSRKTVLPFSTEQLFFSVKAALSKTLQIAGKQTSEHLFYRTGPSGYLLCNSQLKWGSANTMS